MTTEGAVTTDYSDPETCCWDDLCCEQCHGEGGP